jgi:aspartate/tyrosine/aromatic aminotransferase
VIFDSNLDNEYLPTEGLHSFIKNSLILAYGQPIYDRIGTRIAGAQALSGTGALRLACDFLKRFTSDAAVYLPDPTWPNHNNIVRDAGLKQGTYYWYDSATKAANFQRAYEDIKKIPDKQIILLHACAHNPTGVRKRHDIYINFILFYNNKD